MRDVVINYQTGINEQGLRLNRADVESLLFLFEHKLISQPQLFQFYTLIKSIHYDSFRKRIGKFANLGLVQIKKYSISKKRKGVETNLIQLTTKGHWLLKEAGFLNDSTFEINQQGAKWDRSLAIKEVVLHAIKSEGQQHGVVIGGENKHLYLFQKERAARLNLIGKADDEFPHNTVFISAEQFPLEENTSSDEKSFVLKPNILYSFRSFIDMFPNVNHESVVEPDWILGINNNLLNIEVDTGYRTFVKGEANNGETITIEEQMKKYVQLVEKYPLQHTVLYVYLDDSFSFKKNYGKKIQKIRNFKQLIMNDELMKNSPLEIYVLSLESSRNAIETLLRLYRGDITDESLINDTFIYLSNKYLIQGKYSSRLLSSNNARELHYLIPMEELNLHKLFYFSASEGGRVEKILIPIPMYEGNVRNQYHLQQLSIQLKENKLKWGLPDDSKILAIYPNKDSMDKDIFRSDIANEQVILCNLENLAVTDNNSIFYDTTRKGEMSFDEATRNYEG
ncbi:hypothetical protein [Viridibacillus arvi]|uniref:hypothetical protein n=1 Tax=Viridibacillus arvi TaxID=263475 RepID=UPI0034CFC3AA